MYIYAKIAYANIANIDHIADVNANLVGMDLDFVIDLAFSAVFTQK